MNLDQFERKEQATISRPMRNQEVGFLTSGKRERNYCVKSALSNQSSLNFKHKGIVEIEGGSAMYKGTGETVVHNASLKKAPVSQHQRFSQIS